MLENKDYPLNMNRHSYCRHIHDNVGKQKVEKYACCRAILLTFNVLKKFY